MSRPLDRAFFERPVGEVAPDLIGCTLLVEGCGGTIVETERYQQDDEASHSFAGETARTRPMFGPGGFAYIYLSYGIHKLFNVTADRAGHGAAVLIRALEPTIGLEEMRSRRPGRSDRELCSGPGRLAEALGINLSQSGRDLLEPPFTLLSRPEEWREEILTGPRIGISKAVDQPWRFCLSGSRFTSLPRLVPRPAES